MYNGLFPIPMELRLLRGLTGLVATAKQDIGGNMNVPAEFIRWTLFNMLAALGDATISERGKMCFTTLYSSTFTSPPVLA